MKKTLLSCGALVLMGLSASAQLANEGFNGPGLPANWVMINVDNHTVNSGLGVTTAAALTANAWIKAAVTATDSCMYTTSWFDPAGQADRWLITPSFTVNDPNTIIKWQDYTPDGNFPDNVQVWVSPTAGTTVPDFTTKIYDAAGSTEGFAQRGLSLAAYNGQTIRLAFRDNSNDKYLLYLDNIGTAVMTNAKDGSLDNVMAKTIQTTTGSATPGITISNAGAQTITSIQVQYVVDANAPVQQTFSSLNVNPYASTNLTFSTPISGLSAGTHNLTVTILQVNGAADPNAANNVKTRAFAVVDPSTSVSRNGLIEEFSSSTCAPCASFNSTFDPLVVSNNANNGTSRFNIVKYQMNWPNPGNDPSFNTTGNARRGYYGVNGIPDHFTNGAPGGAGNQAEIDASKTDPAFMTISGTFVVHGNQVQASATCTPKFTITGADMSVHMVIAERHYTNNDHTTATVGQYEFYYVERIMNNAGNGAAVTSWTANTPQTFNLNQAFTNGGAAQGNDHFWTNGFNSDLVVFVQDNTDGSILQSISVPAAWPTGVKEMNGIADMAIFPNPATSQAILGFNTTESAKIQISIVDAIGRNVYNYSQVFDPGSQRVVIPTGNLPAGLYNVRVQTDNGVATQRLSVTK